MSNTSATGGYLQAPAAALPGALTLKQFMQSVFAGVSGLPGSLVRPSWQQNPPAQPPADVDWIAIGILHNNGDTNAYSGVDSAGNNLTISHEGLEVQTSFYGPNCAEIAQNLRDGFRIPQNLEALQKANMGFVSCGGAVHAPDLVNEGWVDRYQVSVFLRREIIRSYPILSFVSAAGGLQATVSGALKTFPLKAGV